ncbi:MAG TPA: type II toxin-antitoxin system Phd/YefM family antitoxin, partial [Terriglobales bacterium]|nr:type II toxin-antitoxin system Phd/YefM family antitoxin [Terriglobales bacterium]
MAAGEFKTHCLAVMDEVAKTREPVVITKRGKPVAKVVPVEQPKSKRFIGRLEGVLLPAKGDLTEPTVPL